MNRCAAIVSLTFVAVSFPERPVAAQMGQSIFHYDNAGNLTGVDTTPPAPTNLSAIAYGTTDSQIALCWTKSSPGVTYLVERKTGATGTYALALTDPRYCVSDTGLTQQTTYYYRVRAQNAAGYSAYSNEISATTRPTAPDSLVATVVGATQVKLTWRDRSPAEQGFTVEQAGASQTSSGTYVPGIYTAVAQVPANTTMYTDSVPCPNMTYFYRVKANGAPLDSAYSNEASATIPSLPSAAFQDGRGTVARFNAPTGIAADPGGAYFSYVADTGNNAIRKVWWGNSGWTVSTVAGGGPLQPGSTDAVGASARFKGPRGVALDGSGTLYVADTGNHTIRRITSSGTVTTLAGKAGQPGSVDSTGSLARFNSPRGVAVDSLGNVYVADTGNHTIRMITQQGAVTTLAGLAGQPGSTDGIGSAARFNLPNGIALSGYLYVADTGNSTIRRIYPSAAWVETIAGVAGQPGVADGTHARFNGPVGVAADSHGTVYVADTGNNVCPDSGTWTNTSFLRRYNGPQGIGVDALGMFIYVADTNNNMIYMNGYPLAGSSK